MNELDPCSTTARASQSHCHEFTNEQLRALLLLALRFDREPETEASSKTTVTKPQAEAHMKVP
jgi:hypothetical protein